jgi:drug/metabolite transporter (DMT)-like permease
MFTKHRGEFYLVLGALLFSFNGVIITLVLDHLTAFRLAQVRAIGSFVLLFIVIFMKSRKSLSATKGEIPTLLLYGVFGFAMVQLGYLISIGRNIPLGLVLIIEFTAPIWIVLWIKFVYKRDVARNMWVGIAASLIGLALVARVWEGLTFDLIGILGAVGSSITLAFYFIMGERQGAKRSPEAITVWGMGGAALFWLTVLPVWNFPFSIFTESINLQGALDAYQLPGWALLAWVIIPGTMIPYLLVLNGLHLLDASKASVIGMLEPVFGGVFAWIWLSQSWLPIQLVGAIAVLIGIYIADKTKLAAIAK